MYRFKLRVRVFPALIKMYSILSSTEHYRDDVSPQRLPELLGDIIRAQGVLQGEVELVPVVRNMT